MTKMNTTTRMWGGANVDEGEEEFEEEHGRDFEHEGDYMSMLLRFLKVNRTDVAVVTGV